MLWFPTLNSVIACGALSVLAGREPKFKEAGLALSPAFALACVLNIPQRSPRSKEKRKLWELLYRRINNSWIAAAMRRRGSGGPGSPPSWTASVCKYRVRRRLRPIYWCAEQF